MALPKGVHESGAIAMPIPARLRRHLRGPAHSDSDETSCRASATETLVAYLTAAASGIATACAWLVPETVASAALGWLGAALLVYSMRTRPAYLPAYCGGALGLAIAFYWVFPTVSTFGGFGVAVSGLIFAVYVALAALIFTVFSFFYRNLSATLDRFALRTAVAIALAELVTVRLFPWHYGHTQIAFRPFVQLAALGGAILVSFMLFWVAEAVVRVVVFRERRRELLLPLFVFGLSLGYGAEVMDGLDHRRDTEQEVVVVQGNGSLAEMKELDSLEQVLKRTYELTVSASKPGVLIVWPEGSIPAYLPTDLGSARKDPSLPWLGDGSALLIGAYSFSDEQHRFNSAFAVYPDGTVPVPYFKQILIPFGEYIPGASDFPVAQSGQ